MNNFKTLAIKTFAIAATMAITLPMALSHAEQPENIAQNMKVSVLDGDSFIMGKMRYRIWGLDAAPSKSPKGIEATTALTGFLQGKTVRCDWGGEISYGRLVSICFADGLDIADWMIRNGHGKPLCNLAGEFYLPVTAEDNKPTCDTSK